MVSSREVVNAAVQRRSDGGPVEKSYSIELLGGSVRTTVMMEAIRAEGLSRDDLEGDELTQYYYPDEGIVAIDVRELVDCES